MNCICNLLATGDAAIIKNWLEIAGLLLAGGFIVWKILVGWFAANLNLSISSERVAKDEENDFLAITVTLDKGTTDSVKLKDVSLHISVEGQKDRMERIGIAHLSTEGDQLGWPTDGNAPKEALPKYLLAQGESLQLAKAYDVPSHLPVTVEAAVLAKRAFYKPMQWRAVHISLPKSAGKGIKPQ